jgi:hypothetical protein
MHKARILWSLAALTGLLFLQACGGTAGTVSPSAPAPSGAVPQLTLATVASGLSSPVDLQQPRDGSGRLFAVEKAGTIRIIQNGAVQNSPFLDITQKVDSAPSEMGLLGLAFHPQYAQNRRLFVHYDRRVSGQVQSVVAEYLASSSDPSHADASSERILLTVDQPFENHKGGQLAFGSDGFLYIAFGDGGSEGDPMGNGQNRQTLLGKILGNTLLAVLSVLLSWVYSAGLLGVRMTVASPWLLLVTFAIAIFAFVGFSLMLALLFTLSRNANAIANGLGYPLYVVSGLLFPLTMLPAWALPFGLILPLAWAREALRWAITGPVAAPTLLTGSWGVAIIGLLAVGITYFVAAFWLYRYVFDRKLRQLGQLGVS